MKYFILLILVSLLCPLPVFANTVIRIAAVESTKACFEKLVQEKGGDPLKIDNYSSPNASRPVISLLIIEQALHAGGMDAEIVINSYPNLARCISELKKGKVDVLASDIWEDDFDDQVYKSDPFIRKGDFEKGIYTYKDSPLLKTKPDLATIKQYVPLTAVSWNTDLSTLKTMGFERIETAPIFSLIFRMLSKKRADFSLLEFSKSPDLTYYMNENDRAYPVQGIKIVIPHSRHFMVSRKTKNGGEIFKALERGLRILRKNGTIELALNQSGVRDNRVKNWKVIYPEQAER